MVVGWVLFLLVLGFSFAVVLLSVPGHHFDRVV